MDKYNATRKFYESLHFNHHYFSPRTIQYFYTNTHMTYYSKQKLISCLYVFHYQWLIRILSHMFSIATFSWHRFKLVYDTNIKIFVTRRLIDIDNFFGCICFPNLIIFCCSHILSFIFEYNNSDFYPFTNTYRLCFI